MNESVQGVASFPVLKQTAGLKYLSMEWLSLSVLYLFIFINTAYGFLLNISESLNDTVSLSTSPMPTTTIQITEETTHTLEYQTRKHWADSAFSYIKSLNCSQVYFTSQRECNHLLNVRKRNVVVYVAQPQRSREGDFVAVLPDGGLSRAGSHHGVVTLDPHPDANFGHLVMVFFIDKTNNRGACERHHGKYIGKCDIFNYISVV